MSKFFCRYMQYLYVWLIIVLLHGCIELTSVVFSIAWFSMHYTQNKTYNTDHKIVSQV